MTLDELIKELITKNSLSTGSLPVYFGDSDGSYLTIGEVVIEEFFDYFRKSEWKVKGLVLKEKHDGDLLSS